MNSKCQDMTWCASKRAIKNLASIFGHYIILCFVAHLRVLLFVLLFGIF
nr:MAG TPA: hypothetical protein [Caudoviricetes sp.]